MNIGIEDGEYLAHYGTKGQKWGVRRYQNEDGSLTEEGKKRYGNSVFISGTTKTSEDGSYKRDKLPTKITDKIDEYIGSGRKILVGDAPGIDSQIQDYLSNKNYKNVEVFVSGDEVRKLAGGKLGWTVNNIDGENFEKYSKEWRAVKDKAMNSVASEGLAVVIKDGSGATRKNIDRFIKAGKTVAVYQLDNEDFVDPILNQKEYEKMKHDDLIEKGSNFLAHYGIKGQQWGQRRFQNEDGTLTEEGRRRYGLNPQYSGMTDKDLRDALEKKRTQNEYTQMVTAGARKKQQDIRGFTAEALNVAGQGVNLWDKTKLESDRKEAQTNIDKFTEAKKEYIEKMNDMKDDLGKKAVKKDPTYLGYKSEAEKYENMIKEQKGLKDEGIKAKKDLANMAVNTGKSYAPDLISKGATAREIKEKTAEAQRNIEEMDHEQLKKVVDRMRLEKQYDELMNPPKPSKVERGREVLQTIGALMGVALTALSIAEVVKKLNKKGEVTHSDLIKSGEEFLAHYRTKGSRNGVRRYQNEDGSLTPEGYRHYGIDPNGRQAVDPREILARQRAQEKADARQAKAERRQAGYTQKFAERQALRDAKNQIRIQNIYDRQMVRAQQEQYRVENQAKAENRANLRKNIIKGIAATAFIGAALYTGRHFLQQRALDNQLARDVTKMSEETRNKIELVRNNADSVMYEAQTNRMKVESEINNQRNSQNSSQTQNQTQPRPAQNQSQNSSQTQNQSRPAQNSSQAQNQSSRSAPRQEPKVRQLTDEERERVRRENNTKDHKQGWEDIQKREIEVEASRRELEKQDILEARMDNVRKIIDEKNARDARTRDHKQAWDKLVKSGALEKVQVKNGIIFDRRTREIVDKKHRTFLRNYLGHEEDLFYVIN